VVSAKSQTGGYGRFGRAWTSPPGNLYWTMALARQPHWPADHGLTFAAGLAVADVLAAAGVDPGRIRLKWPNDALVDERKIAGVLAKASNVAAAGAPASAIVGIGINVASYPEDAVFPATSLIAAGIPHASVDALRDLLTQAFLARLAQWEDGGFPALRPDYERRLHGIGRLARITADRDRTSFIQGINRGIDATGALRLELASGEIHLVRAGDVLAL
jgi:BirA family biotin operon repressor/biotin-[acetyl-CoA-carboxylase] ligase